MGDETKGSFLKGKLVNMARWVTEEVGRENLPVDVIAGIAGRSELECCVLAGALQASQDEVTHRNWSGLVRLMEQEHLPRELQEVIAVIQKRPPMHDKFWRYLKLFIEVGAQ